PVACLRLSVLRSRSFVFLLLFFHAPATTEIYTLSLHDALPISQRCLSGTHVSGDDDGQFLEWVWHAFLVLLLHPGKSQHPEQDRSEEHTSELQSRENLVCRLLLEKKKNKETRAVLSTMQQPRGE